MASRIDHSADNRGARLTVREQEVTLLLVQGASAKLISQILGLSPRTVDVHASSIIRKLGARNRTHAVALAVYAGIATPDPGLDRLPRQCARRLPSAAALLGAARAPVTG